MKPRLKDFGDLGNHPALPISERHDTSFAQFADGQYRRALRSFQQGFAGGLRRRDANLSPRKRVERDSSCDVMIRLGAPWSLIHLCGLSGLFREAKRRELPQFSIRVGPAQWIEKRQPGARFDSFDDLLANLRRITLPRMQPRPEDDLVPGPGYQVVGDVCMSEAVRIAPILSAIAALFVEITEPPFVRARVAANGRRFEIEIEALGEFDDPATVSHVSDGEGF